MYQFTLYQHDWKEPFDTGVVNYCIKKMKGPIEITDLEVKGDCYDYCIHTSGISDELVQRIADAWYRVDETEWFQKRFDTKTDFLTLKDEDEIEEMIEMYLDSI